MLVTQVMVEVRVTHQTLDHHQLLLLLTQVTQVMEEDIPTKVVTQIQEVLVTIPSTQETIHWDLIIHLQVYILYQHQHKMVVTTNKQVVQVTYLYLKVFKGDYYGILII